MREGVEQATRGATDGFQGFLRPQQFRFREAWGFWRYPPSPLDLWNHRVRGKLENNLWRSMSYGQNLENIGLPGKPFTTGDTEDHRESRYLPQGVE
jgi:hypothetical protein